ncbi:uncharacterized protein ARMOST_18433 [Armillaria ostoyae]|uniref:Uncharacterized protein n=1 Tax=Armillaria ostoyae TaxID=47428 RepID=A0A284S1V1_ARMOS|nr:uncharacterized protein ARMOST_18433 [Armillaria ostoyae]
MLPHHVEALLKSPLLCRPALKVLVLCTSNIPPYILLHLISLYHLVSPSLSTLRNGIASSLKPKSSVKLSRIFPSRSSLAATSDP